MLLPTASLYDELPLLPCQLWTDAPNNDAHSYHRPPVLLVLLLSPPERNAIVRRVEKARPAPVNFPSRQPANEPHAPQKAHACGLCTGCSKLLPKLMRQLGLSGLHRIWNLDSCQTCACPKRSSHSSFVSCAPHPFHDSEPAYSAICLCKWSGATAPSCMGYCNLRFF